MKKIVLGNYYPLILASLKAVLKEYRIVGEARDGVGLVRQTIQYQPDLVIVDVLLPGINVVSAIKEILKNLPRTKIIIHTELAELPAFMEDDLWKKIAGFCHAFSQEEDLAAIVALILAGGIYIGKEYLHLFLPASEKERFDIKISHRERDVLKMIGEGHQNKFIADYLCISPKTVEKHRSNIMVATGIHNTPGLVALAIEKGLCRRFNAEHLNRCE